MQIRITQRSRRQVEGVWYSLHPPDDLRGEVAQALRKLGYKKLTKLEVWNLTYYNGGFRAELEGG